MLIAPDRSARINGAVERTHANVQVVFGGGLPFGAILTREVADPFQGAMDVPGLSLEFMQSRAPGVINGSELVIDGVAHIVSSPVQADASGWLTVTVYRKVA